MPLSLPPQSRFRYCPRRSGRYRPGITASGLTAKCKLPYCSYADRLPAGSIFDIVNLSPSNPWRRADGLRRGMAPHVLRWAWGPSHGCSRRGTSGGRPSEVMTRAEGIHASPPPYAPRRAKPRGPASGRTGSSPLGMGSFARFQFDHTTKALRWFGCLNPLLAGHGVHPSFSVVGRLFGGVRRRARMRKRSPCAWRRCAVLPLDMGSPPFAKTASAAIPPPASPPPGGGRSSRGGAA